MKNKLDEISAIPSKRIYLSIIADYHLHLALCELIDNAIDNWIYNGRENELLIQLDLDYDQQSIVVKDNSGGIKEDDISLIVSPGQSRETSNEEIIGVFGVGSKRAVVALAEQVKILSRHSNEKTLLIELDNNWIQDEDNWELPTYEVDPIEENTTRIELHSLREKIENENHPELLKHLGATYAFFIEAGGLTISVNGNDVISRTFENWAYPPGYEPQEKSGPIDFKDKGKIEVSITGGLIKSHRGTESNNEEYGVYFYCNDRLISRANKSREVGFNNTPNLGKPHPRFSLARIVVKLTGPVSLMPWNSSKSEIDFKHKAYKEIENHIKRIVTTYANMSGNWSGEWPERVFQYTKGKVKKEKLDNISHEVRLRLPIVPRKARPPKYIDLIKRQNKEIARNKPWTIGLYEAIIAVEEIKKLKLEQSNRLCLLILDSTLEIGFKEFLLNESGTVYTKKNIRDFDRVSLQNKVKTYNKIKKSVWIIIDSYYIKRCDLVYERATTQISDAELESYREVVEYTLNKLFKLQF